MEDVRKEFGFRGIYVYYFRNADDTALSLKLETRDNNNFIIWIRKDGTIDYFHEQGKWVYNHTRYKTLKDIKNVKNPFAETLLNYDYEPVKHSIESTDTNNLTTFDFIISLISMFYNEFEKGDLGTINVEPPS